MENIKDKKYIKDEVYEIDQQMDEGWGENLLLMAGFIPVIGDVADIILIIKFLKEKRYIEAGLMLFALIPVVGQALVNPIIKAGRGVKGAFASSEMFAKFLSKSPKLESNFVKLGKYMKDTKVGQLVNQIAKKSPKAAQEMKVAQNMHLNVLGKVESKVATKPLGAARMVKNHFQDQALAKYIAKHGVAPQTWLSNWYNVVFKGRQMRRDLANKIIMGSNLLNLLGLPSMRSLEQKMEDPEQMAELMQHPEMQNLVQQTTSPEDREQITQMSKGESSKPGIGSEIGSALTGFIGINALKSIARFV